MAQTPIDVRNRPFSVEPITGVMMPDGIFDAAIFQQRITCHFTNTGAASLNNVTIYVEGVSDLGIGLTPATFTFASIPAGASVLVGWLGDFQHASPGKKNVSFIAQAGGMDLRRMIKKIFVTRTTFDAATGTYSCETPEGSMKVKFNRIIDPPKEGWQDCGDKTRRGRGPWLVDRITMQVAPNPAYTGQFGELPFQDPWWKVVGWVVFAVAAIVAIIAAIAGHGTAGIGVSGTFDETSGDVDCCSPDPGATKDTTGADTVAGIASIVATVGLAVGLADAKDPWRRGQEATAPGGGEVTLGESVRAEFRYPEPVIAGRAYAVQTSWRYTRITNVREYGHAVEESVNNTHLLDHLEVDAPVKITHFDPDFVIKARFFREGGKRYAGDRLNAFALLLSPTKRGFRVPLVDDGIAPDAKANDGEYTGRFDLRAAYRVLLKDGDPVSGLWRVHVFAQDINDADANMSPTDAATHIGGFMVASALEVTFDGSTPCPLKAQATTEVIV